MNQRSGCESDRDGGIVNQTGTVRFFIRHGRSGCESDRDSRVVNQTGTFGL